jgi:hypothetical protein
MSFDNIVVGDYGQVAKVTFIDVDTNMAANISGYASTLQMIFTSPSDVETAKTATFDTDGSDGVIKYIIETGLINESGGWSVRGRVQGISSKLTTVEHNFEVLE